MGQFKIFSMLIRQLAWILANLNKRNLLSLYSIDLAKSRSTKNRKNNVCSEFLLCITHFFLSCKLAANFSTFSTFFSFFFLQHPGRRPQQQQSRNRAVNCCRKDLHTRGCSDPRSTSFLCKCNLTKSYLASLKLLKHFSISC